MKCQQLNLSSAGGRMNHCIFSSDLRYRYTLTHDIDITATQLTVCWIGLNPSTADEDRMDPTLRRIRSFSLRQGFGRFIMCNLYAFRSSKPYRLREVSDPVGKENNFHISGSAWKSNLIVAAWGAITFKKERAQQVMKILEPIGVPVMCLGRTKEGHPRHPLFVRGDQELEVFSL